MFIVFFVGEEYVSVNTNFESLKQSQLVVAKFFRPPLFVYSRNIYSVNLLYGDLMCSMVRFYERASLYIARNCSFYVSLLDEELVDISEHASKKLRANLIRHVSWFFLKFPSHFFVLFL